ASEVTSGVAWTVTSRVTLIMTLETTQEAGGESLDFCLHFQAKFLSFSIHRDMGRFEGVQASDIGSVDCSVNRCRLRYGF
ncbi:MAG: hypothetical protein JSU73_11045, partial [candidate division WOR-3 bacterium]